MGPEEANGSVSPDTVVTGTYKQFQDQITAAKSQAVEDYKAELAKTKSPFIIGNGGAGSKGAYGSREEQSQPGLLLTRYYISLALAKNSRDGALKNAEERFAKTRSMVDDAVVKALTMSSFEGGGALVPDSVYQDFIEFIYPDSVIRNLGATQLPLVNGSLSLNKETKGMQPSYIGQGKPAPIDQPEFGRLKLTTKELALMTPVENKLLRSIAGAQVEASIMRNMQDSFSATENIQFIRGDGTQNTPKGIRNLITDANILTANSTVNLANITADLMEIMTVVEEALENKVTKPGWLMHTRVKRFLMSLRDGNGNYAFMDELKAGRLLDAPVKTVNQIPKNIGTGGNKTEVMFGDFSKVIIGDDENMIADSDDRASYWNGETLVSAYSNNETVFRMIVGHDIGLRNDNAIAVLEDVAWML